jgi:hypothetical protein
MAISDGSGGAPIHFDASSGIDNRGVSRRSLFVGGAAVLAGAGLMKPARAFAAGPDGGASETMGSEPFGLSPAQQVGQRVIWSYPGLTPPQALLAWIRGSGPRDLRIGPRVILVGVGCACSAGLWSSMLGSCWLGHSRVWCCVVWRGRGGRVSW